MSAQLRGVVRRLLTWRKDTSGLDVWDMAQDPAPVLRLSEMKDPLVLFERYNTEEIRRIERRVRGDIEQKKEELRQMVGERYRDLIDAADTIGEMRQCSERVVRSVQDMQRFCQLLKQSRPGAGAAAAAQVSYRLRTHFSPIATRPNPDVTYPLCVVVEPEAGPGRVLLHGGAGRAPAGHPGAHLERHGGCAVPAGHAPLPAVLPPARPAAARLRLRGPL